MPLTKATKQSKAKLEEKRKKVLLKEKQDNKKRIKYCKKHERYHGAGCIDCINSEEDS